MELFSICTKGLFIQSIFLLFHLFGNLAFNIKNRNNCPVQSDALRLLIRVSFKECLNQCNIRNHCKLICYRTATKLCEIHGSTARITSCKRCVSVRQEEKVVTPITCDDCNDGKTCNTTTGICEYTECGDFDFPLGKTYGNLAHVGSKKLNLCFDPPDIAEESICTERGEWTNVPSCENTCPSQDGILTLADDFHVIFCNLGVTKEDAHGYCNAMRGALIRVDKENKMAVLLQKINSKPELGRHDYWVDGFSENGKDVSGWKFSDGTQMLMDKIFWADHAPNGDGPNCVRMSSGFNHLLDDKECDQLFHYACRIH